jgi:hypothetical protein
LVEITPIPLEKHYLRAAALKADPVRELPYGEKLRLFKAELAALRAKYTPFLQNHVPDPPRQDDRRVPFRSDFTYVPGYVHYFEGTTPTLRPFVPSEGDGGELGNDGR